MKDDIEEYKNWSNRMSPKSCELDGEARLLFESRLKEGSNLAYLPLFNRLSRFILICCARGGYYLRLGEQEIGLSYFKVLPDVYNMILSTVGLNESYIEDLAISERSSGPRSAALLFGFREKVRQFDKAEERISAQNDFIHSDANSGALTKFLTESAPYILSDNRSQSNLNQAIKTAMGAQSPQDLGDYLAWRDIASTTGKNLPSEYPWNFNLSLAAIELLPWFVNNQELISENYDFLPRHLLGFKNKVIELGTLPELPEEYQSTFYLLKDSVNRLISTFK
ncbi:hypothetical protein [Microbulbifer agarilyticus]